jgi:predicted lipoprotein with Yx(FWY)xxD motif
MKTKRLVGLAALFAIASLASCSKKDANQPAPQAIVTDVKLTNNTKLGSIITDNLGNSLYFFSKDAGGTATCVGQCAVVWPPFYKDNPSLGTGLAAADFGVITRTDGTMQTTYKGWPLYYYASDLKAGDTNGDAIGNLWAIGKADYSVMFANSQLVGHDGLQYNDQGVAAAVSSQYLTDPYGRTLYLFTKDTHNTNVFTKPDLSNNGVWPINEVTAVGSIPTVFDKTLFTTIIVFGKTQLVFRGHPTYQFGQDAGLRGNTKGVSFPTPGAAIWKILNADTPSL